MVKLYNKLEEELDIIHSTFPAGEVYVRIYDTSKVTESMHVILYDASAEAIMRAVMLSSACTNAGATWISLYTSYIPYSRQDRVCHDGESNSFFEFQKIINGSFDEIITVDLHNPEAARGALVQYYVDYTSPMLNVFSEYADTLKVSTDALVLAPDKGALDRATRFAKSFSLEFSYLEKTRTANGITQSIAEPDKVARANTIIIVDDICDGGRTFIEAAKEIRKVNAKAPLYLVVSHGIFSAGLRELREHFKCVFVPDNLYNRNRLEK